MTPNNLKYCHMLLKGCHKVVIKCHRVVIMVALDRHKVVSETKVVL